GARRLRARSQKEQQREQLEPWNSCQAVVCARNCQYGSEQHGVAPGITGVFVWLAGDEVARQQYVGGIVARQAHQLVVELYARRNGPKQDERPYGNAVC